MSQPISVQDSLVLVSMDDSHNITLIEYRWIRFLSPDSVKKEIIVLTIKLCLIAKHKALDFHIVTSMNSNVVDLNYSL